MLVALVDRAMLAVPLNAEPSQGTKRLANVHDDGRTHSTGSHNDGLELAGGHRLRCLALFHALPFGALVAKWALGLPVWCLRLLECRSELGFSFSILAC